MAFAKTNVQLEMGMVVAHVGGTGRNVLMLHSAGGARISPALERLSETHRLHLLVFPGFDGEPELARVTSMRGLADLADAYIRAVIKEPCDVIGHSFGGWAAAWLAATHPENVQQLVLAGAAGFRPEGVGGLDGDPATLQRRMYAHPENAAADERSPATRAANRATATRYTGGVATDADLVTRLGDIEALTLIVHGTKDGIIPVESPRLLKARIPHATLLFIYDAAHSIDVDQPVRFAGVVDDFLTRGEAFIVNDGSDSAA
jgi:pimeloyl-ACP methyl ester carboxylesterase